MFSSIYGNEPIKAYLKKALRDNRLPQTLLFAGPNGVGKGLFARALASQLLKSNRSPDLHILKPEGKSGLYAIDTLREMIDKEHAAPFEAPGKVFILEDAERMQPASANALLKTLEEPSPDTTFILLSSAPQEILSTILSRTVTLFFQPLAEELVAALLQGKGSDPGLAKLAHGSAGTAFELAENVEFDEQRKLVFQILSQKPPYPELSLLVDKLAAFAEAKKEEDPVRASQHIDHIFSSILMWHRDQNLQSIGASSGLLFYPEEPLVKDLPSIDQVEKRIEKVRLASHRNIKLSVCLLDFFLFFHPL